MKTEIAAVLLTIGLASSCWSQDTPPNEFLPSIRERQRYSDVVCSAKIVMTHATSNVKQTEGQVRSEWIAEVQVDHIFKGSLRL